VVEVNHVFFQPESIARRFPDEFLMGSGRIWQLALSPCFSPARMDGKSRKFAAGRITSCAPFSGIRQIKLRFATAVRSANLAPMPPRENNATQPWLFLHRFRRTRDLLLPRLLSGQVQIPNTN
jgi:hypothetical protein